MLCVLSAIIDFAELVHAD